VPLGTPPGTQTSLNAEEITMAKSMGYSQEEWKKLKEASK
jgi:phage I-like protein